MNPDSGSYHRVSELTTIMYYQKVVCHVGKPDNVNYCPTQMERKLSLKAIAILGTER